MSSYHLCHLANRPKVTYRTYFIQFGLFASIIMSYIIIKLNKLTQV